MRTNGFALFEGEGAPAAAKDALRRVERYPGRAVVDAGAGFEEASSARLSGKKQVALAYSLERSGGFPLVHGFVEGALDFTSLPIGEFSALGREKGGFLAARDALGTRGLWVGDGSLASDHRLVEGDARLVPPGSVWKGRRSRKASSDLGEPRKAGSFEDAGEALASLVDQSVRERVIGQKRVAVSFSGGLDSSLIALVASRYTDVVLCSAYVEGSLDEKQTEKAAALLGLRLKTAVLDEGSATDSKAELPPGEVTLMDRSLWCIYSTTSELASRSKAGVMLLGQLADELFGGYRKYAIKAREEGAAAAEEMMAKDVRGCADRGFIRDEAACSRWAEVRFPYADSRIASFARGVPFEYKVRGEERKAVLRYAALRLGLPEEIASAPKKAAQFSSGTAKLFKRLTGF